MWQDFVDARTPSLPRCPSCAQSMRLVRTTQRFDDLPTLHMFECRTCEVAFVRET